MKVQVWTADGKIQLRVDLDVENGRALTVDLPRGPAGKLGDMIQKAMENPSYAATLEQGQEGWTVEEKKVLK